MTVRFTRGPRTDLSDTATQARFQTTRFPRDARADRMEQALTDGSFATQQALTALSESVQPGDIQIADDGTLFVL